MAFESAAVTVETTATLIATGGSGAGRTRGTVVTVKPATAAEGASVFLGPASVTAAAGCPLGGGMSFDLADDEELYGIVASGTIEVRVMEHSI